MPSFPMAAWEQELTTGEEQMLESSWTWLLTHGLRLALILAGTLVVWRMVRVISRRLEEQVMAGKVEIDDRTQQIRTLIRVGSWATTAIVLFIATLMVLSELGVNIGPILASAGVVGLALSLGTQTLVRDLIGGFLIVLEDLFALGDVIRVGDVSGKVERITLRATYLRDFEGRLHIIPNGEIRILSNLSRDWSRAVVDVGVAYEEDIGKVCSVLEEVGKALQEDPAFGPNLLEPPTVVGVMALEDWAVTVRIMARTIPGKQHETRRELLRRIKEAFQAKGIAIPYPRQELWVRRVEDS